MTTKKPREIEIFYDPSNDELDQIFEYDRGRGDPIAEAEGFTLVREVLPVDEVTEDEILEQAKLFEHRDEPTTFTTKYDRFIAGARWAISEMKKRGGV